MGIVVIIMTSMFDGMNRETRALSEKLASSDLEKALIAALADGSVCSYLLTPPGSGAAAAVFNPSGLDGANPNAVTISLPTPSSGQAALYASINNSTTPPTPGPIVAQVEQIASAYSNSLVVKSIQLSITACSGSSGAITCNGKWVIGWDNKKTVRPLKPNSISTILTANVTSATSAIITGCQGSGANNGPPSNCVRRYATTVTAGPCGIDGQANCQPNEYAIGGGTAFASNIALQNSYPILQSGKMTGWYTTFYDTNGCTINQAVGSTAPGTNPCFTTSWGTMCGGPVVTCCQ